MSLTIYGLLIFGYSLFICFTSKDLKKIFIEFFTIAIFLYLNISIGYVVKFGEQTIAGYFFAMLLSAIVAVPFLKKMEFKRFNIVAIFTLSVIISAVLILFIDYRVVDSGGWDIFLFGVNNTTICKLDGWHIKEITKIFLFIVIVEVVHKMLNEADWVYIINKVLKWTKVVLCYGIFEFILVYVFNFTNLYNTLLRPIFGVKDSTYVSALIRGEGFQLQGLRTEPSAYTTGLFLIVLLFLVQNVLDKDGKTSKRYRTNWMWISICLGLMLVCMSFSSILYLAVLAILLFLHIYKAKPNYRAAILFLVGFFVAFGVAVFVWLINSGTYYGERLRSAVYVLNITLTETDFNNLWFHVVDKTNDGSIVSRLGSAVGILKLEFLQNPLLGLGVGTGNAYAIIPNMLTDLGLLGIVAWFKQVTDKTKRNIYVVIVYMVIVVSGCLAVPFSYSGADAILLVYMVDVLFGKRELCNRIS